MVSSLKDERMGEEKNTLRERATQLKNFLWNIFSSDRRLGLIDSIRKSFKHKAKDISISIFDGFQQLSTQSLHDQGNGFVF